MPSKTSYSFPIVPVILCGGSGTRLWPISRNQSPKQFLTLTGDKSLLQQTATRALEITNATPENLLTITLANFTADVSTQLTAISPDCSKNILSEPSARNTAAAIAYAALYTKQVFGENAIMWILPSDHHIGKTSALKESFTHALDAANQDYLVTFGIKPTRPETGYGYIKTGKSLNKTHSLIIDQFVEKPDIDTARIYLDSGAYLWNSGMFLFKTSTVLNQFEQFSPDILKMAQQSLAASIDKKTPEEKAYNLIEKTPFDIAIMEKSNKRAVVPCDPNWSDIGSWESLWSIKEKDQNNNSINGTTTTVTTTNSLILNNGKKTIATAGLDHIAVVDTGDAILVVDLKRSQDIKLLVEQLKQEGKEHLLEKFL